MPLWLTTPTQIHSDPQGSPQMAPYPHNLLPLPDKHQHTEPLAPAGKPILLHESESEVKVAQSCLSLCNPMDYPPGQNTGVGSLSLLQGIFPTQGSNPGLPHCGLILYQLSHKGSPKILEWIAYPFSRGSSQPRNRTRVSSIAGGFFTNWVMREAFIT